MDSLTATVILPTSGDRSEVVRLALACILNQTVQDLEVFIIGDGVEGVSKEILQDLANQDDRVHFHDHPKFVSRGEPYRHEALQEAKGRIVTYSCDRDLWLPHHLETMDQALKEVDFAHSLEFIVQTDGTIETPRHLNLSKPRHRQAMQPRMRRFNPFMAPGLSCTGHTLEAYHRLPEGWTQTPTSYISDCYMWRKFSTHPDITTRTVAIPTLLYFHRGRFPGISLEERVKELKPWKERVMNDPGLYTEMLERSLEGVYFERSDILDSYPLRIKQFFTHYTEKSVEFLQRIQRIGLRGELRRRQGKDQH